MDGVEFEFYCTHFPGVFVVALVKEKEGKYEYKQKGKEERENQRDR
jgi:hypothetical protein